MVSCGGESGGELTDSPFESALVTELLNKALWRRGDPENIFHMKDVLGFNHGLNTHVK